MINILESIDVASWFMIPSKLLTSQEFRIFLIRQPQQTNTSVQFNEGCKNPRPCGEMV